VEILQGLRRRDRGRVRVLGMDPQRDGDRLRRRIGAQLQSSALPDRLRVGEALFIALALVNRPEVVFFDELTTGLDPQARRATWDLVRRVRDDGATVVLVTHFMEEAEELSDRVAIVDRGRVVATGTPSELVRRADATQRVSFTWPDANAAWLSHLAGVARVTRRGDAVEVVGDGALAVRVAAGLAGRGVAPDDFRTHHPDLEGVFLALTGRDLRA
jgi:ABC-2 type transport system ATP-binding protein